MARNAATRSVLMVAFHFPPFGRSSGIQRTLRFVRHLPEFGWNPVVLTATPNAYVVRATDQLAEVSEAVPVHRAFALDADRHLSFLGLRPRFLRTPDRWISWALWAIPEGKRMIREFRPSIIWTTYPIATAHLIGSRLHRASGLPWVADFRDPMAQDGYPEDPAIWRSFKEIEANAAANASACVFTTPSACSRYAHLYSRTSSGKFVLIENGYDEESFDSHHEPGETGPLVPGKITLVHSGIIYPSERDPTQLFDALSRLRSEHRAWADRLVVRLRATQHDQHLAPLIERFGLQDVVELAPPLPYRAALQEMMRADGLLVLQAASCNQQVPAKVYEYLRAGRPILALADPMGDTGTLLRQAGVGEIAPLESSEQIFETFQRFCEGLANGNAVCPNPDVVAAASRRNRTQALARLFDAVER